LIQRFSTYILISLSLCLSLGVSASYLNSHLPYSLFSNIKRVYGKPALNRARDWQQLMQADYKNDHARVLAVNKFFNGLINYRTDIRHWGKNDYWATPVESIGTLFGDCEDFAIAKLLTLNAMGIDENNIRLMYVRAIDWDEPHMVTIYYPDLTGNHFPLVLDNLIDEVKTADQRIDLKPIYSFNGQGLWLSKAKGLGNDVSKGKRLDKWVDLINKIEENR
jgi:predicted transglutaminase-like cysteine proteinase